MNQLRGFQTVLGRTIILATFRLELNLISQHTPQFLLKRKIGANTLNNTHMRKNIYNFFIEKAGKQRMASGLFSLSNILG